jgi:hypothetical protein
VISHPGDLDVVADRGRESAVLCQRHQRHRSQPRHKIGVIKRCQRSRRVMRHRICQLFSRIGCSELQALPLRQLRGHLHGLPGKAVRSLVAAVSLVTVTIKTSPPATIPAWSLTAPDGSRIRDAENLAVVRR